MGKTTNQEAKNVKRRKIDVTQSPPQEKIRKKYETSEYMKLKQQYKPALNNVDHERFGEDTRVNISLKAIAATTDKNDRSVIDISRRNLYLSPKATKKRLNVFRHKERKNPENETLPENHSSKSPSAIIEKPTSVLEKFCNLK